MPSLSPKRPSESFTEMTQVVLPNDANPLGFILGGTVMHLIDIVTAAVDGLQFLHPIKIGDLIILRATVTAAYATSLEVEVKVYSEETLTGTRRMTSQAYLTFVAINNEYGRIEIPPLLLETDEEKRKAWEADGRREARLVAKQKLKASAGELA